MIFSSITLNVFWKQNECLRVYSQLYMHELVFQDKRWDSHPQEKGFNKENALRIQGQ